MAKKESKEQLSITIARHYDNGENNLSARNESRILYLRNFNNWVKSTLIKEAGEFLNEFGIRDKNVLDLACGKGGDLNKWRNMNGIKNLVAADISNGSITNCKSRYEDMKRRSKDSLFKAKFIVADCTRVMINQFFINTKAPIHLVSCQFAFHYCFESIQQAQCMLRNISENLVSGGLFIGTIPSADEIVRRLKNCGNKKFGNSIYSIEFECNTDKLPLFGAKYNFHLEGVVDCPEFLVHFPLLIELAKKFGLELKMKMNFSEYFKKYSILDLKFLSRIRALELYPPHNGNKTMGIDEEYIKAKQFLVDSNINSVGTLTVSEWEVATLYMVFMFQKT
ncbi:mRNA cap guanine-N7 methyltransferase [Daktulosphaira vitifoliae]|uniref:mRNA cap guanine-N7 methyltransferase n=1 Tax=Daktulosphaira vitifoliae TaxID=58002 RepID=UPI0021A9AD89|nr:mRNA cap guanine-N7 methyltransferase [Daktulosphaira vitifoliae]